MLEYPPLNKPPQTIIGLIPVDSIYTPVRKVNYTVELRTFIISSSVLEIRSSTVLMLARLRQLYERTGKKMSHNRKLGRTSDQRRAMLRAMVTYLLENGQIKPVCVQYARNPLAHAKNPPGKNRTGLFCRFTPAE